MFNKRFLLIGGIALLLLIALLFLFWSYTKKSDVVTNDNFIEIPSADGQKIRINNFYKTSSRVDKKSVDIKTEIINGQYEGISYNEEGNVFLLSTNAIDLKEFEMMRKDIEAKFMNLLGINEESACRLNVQIWNTPSPDEALNKVFGLSFCK